jgi:hypothetical protein
MTKKKTVYIGDEKIQIESKPKAKRTKAKKVEKVDVEAKPEAAPEPKADAKRKKEKCELTEEEKQNRLQQLEARRKENIWREWIAEKRRPIQAEALWYMYKHGELTMQHIHYHSDVGEIDQVMLLSHPSKHAI